MNKNKSFNATKPTINLNMTLNATMNQWPAAFFGLGSVITAGGILYLGFTTFINSDFALKLIDSRKEIQNVSAQVA